MKKLSLALSVFAAFIGMISGCCNMQPVGNCRSCGPLRNLAGVCGAPCGGCGSCNDCVGVGLSCSSGCGETYVGERYNVRPTCDPCGYSGDYTGGSCGPCGTQLPILHRFARLLAIGYFPSCGGCGECSDCSSGHGGCESCGISESVPTIPSPRSGTTDRSLIPVPSQETIQPIPDPNVSRRTVPNAQSSLASSTVSRMSPARQKQQGVR